MIERLKEEVTEFVILTSVIRSVFRFDAKFTLIIEVCIVTSKTPF